jgi:EAL domain-containing protein (putative c-di-GMP-specific phosphodiesterase class I)
MDLRKALQSNQFVLHYQPQMALRGNRIVGVETLLRWQHPVRGLVSPVQFVPVLEDMGLIQEVGAWVLREACRQATVWANPGMPLRVAIKPDAPAPGGAGNHRKPGHAGPGPRH